MEEEKKTKNWKETSYYKIGLTVFLTIAACIIFYFVLLRIGDFAGIIKKFLVSGQSIIIGLALAYILNPVMKKCEKMCHYFLDKRMTNQKKCKKICRALGVAGAIIFLFAILALLLAAVVPAFIKSAVHLAETLPYYVSNFISDMQKGDFGDSEAVKYLETYLTNATNFIEEWATTKLLPQAQTYLTQLTSGVISVVRGLLNFLIGIIAAIYVMSIQETLKGQSKKVIYALLKPKKGNYLIEIIREVNRIFGGFVSGKILDSAIIGVICYFGCLILRIPDAILVSVIVGVFNIIPFFGPFIGAIPSIFLVLVQSPIHAVYLLIFIIVLQQVDGNIIGPKILGNSTGLSSFWVLFAILIFGGMFGFLGMLFGVPVFAVIYYLVRQYVNYLIRKKNLTEVSEEYIKIKAVDEKTNTFIYSENYEKAGRKENESEEKKEM